MLDSVQPFPLGAGQCTALPLAGMSLPGATGAEASPRDCRVLQDLVLHTCPHPSYKLLTVESAPRMPLRSLEFATDTWSSVVPQVADSIHGLSARSRAQLCGGGGDRTSKALASFVVLRGRGSLQEVTLAALSSWLPGHLYQTTAAHWHPSGPVATAGCERAMSLEYAHDKTATIVSNCQAVVPFMEHAIIRATQMLHSKAYLHHYERFGVIQLDLEDALVKAEQILGDYQAM